VKFYVSHWFVLAQVSGYVLLAYIYHTDIIPLNNLRVIRGHKLLKLPNNEDNLGYSLYVASNNALRELQLTSLHGEILSHDILSCWSGVSFIAMSKMQTYRHHLMWNVRPDCTS